MNTSCISYLFESSTSLNILTTCGSKNEIVIEMTEITTAPGQEIINN